MIKHLPSAASLVLFFGLSGPLLCGCSSTPDAPVAKKKKKKKSKKPQQVAKLPKGAAEGLVMFSFKDAWLRRDVLPVFYEQAGVRIKWAGPERKVSLRLTQPVDWNLALDLVCRFTKTHPTKDYRGQIVLKPGYGGSLGSSSEAEEALGEAGKEEPGAAGGQAGPTSKSNRTYQKSPSGGSGAYRETTTNSRGGDGSGGSYNSGNKPSDLLKRVR